MMPEPGDIIKVDLDPKLGHEQKGYRPCLVLSNKYYNSRIKMCVIVPITNSKKGYPFEVELDKTINTTGVVLTDHISTIDLTVRKFKIVDKVSDNTLQSCLSNIAKLIEIK